MEKYILIFLISFSFIISIEDYNFLGVYNFIYEKKYLLVYKDNKVKINSPEKCDEMANFRITKTPNNEYYFIEHANSNLKLSGSPGKLEFTSEEDLDTNEWTFIKVKNKFKIKNKNQCYIALTSSKITCKKNSNIAINFKMEKIYEEVNHTIDDLELIDKEPIDILIKYIDLSDPTLVRKGIPQIKKDEDNEELRFSVRSIIKNIPWIRKIFILMPNKKVRYFKDYDLIKEKIVYVLDKDLIGFDSANSHSFQFRAWMMERFNMSENFIIIDDDYFIGKPLNKSDFFHVNNGKVVPSIITRNFIEISKDFAENEHKYYKKRLTHKQTYEDFFYSVSNTYLFLLKLFGSPKFIPRFTHNAIPCNTKELKEIYDIVNNSKYQYPTLDSIFRHLESLQFQTFYMGYTFSKFNKKVNYINYTFISNEDSLNADYNYNLFVINTGGGQNSEFSFNISRMVMEYLFPEPTPFESYNSDLPVLSFDIIKELYKQKTQLSIYTIIQIFIFVLILVIIFYIYKKKKKKTKEYQIIEEENVLKNEEKSKDNDFFEGIKTEQINE